ncbi:hypothetical protein CSKR_102150, partial [Clonorchis sinensis]
TEISIKPDVAAPAAMAPKGSTRAGILSGCPSLDRGSREAEVGFEPLTFRTVNSRSNHMSHLYNHELFRVLVVKKRKKWTGKGLNASLPQLFRSTYTFRRSFRQPGGKLTTKMPLTSVSSNVLQRLQPDALRITESSYWKAICPDRTLTFRKLSDSSLQGQVSQLYNKTPHTVSQIGRRDPSLADSPTVTLQSELLQRPRCTKRSTTLRASPWIVSGVFSDYMSTSMILNSVDEKLIPTYRMTLVSRSTCAFSSSLEMRTMSSARSRSTRFSSSAIFEDLSAFVSISRRSRNQIGIN